jgi:hypothetical protein
MTTNSTAESLQGEIELRELSRRASLLQLARGRKMFSLYDAVYLFLVAMLFVFVYLDRAHIPVGVFHLFLIVIFLNLLHTTRIQKRLIAIIDLLELQKNERDFRN